MYIFQLFDNYAGSRIILLTAFCECIGIGFIYGKYGSLRGSPLIWFPGCTRTHQLTCRATDDEAREPSVHRFEHERVAINIVRFSIRSSNITGAIKIDHTFWSSVILFHESCDRRHGKTVINVWGLNWSEARKYIDNHLKSTRINHSVDVYQKVANLRMLLVFALFAMVN